MSIINGFRTRDRIILITDTASFAPDGKRTRDSSKFLYLPHLHVVIADRGAEFVAVRLYVEILMASLRSFDELVAWMPPVLRRVAGEWQQFAKQSGRDMQALVGAGAEIMVFGFSAATGEMLALVFSDAKAGMVGAEGAVSWRETGWAKPVVVDGVFLSPGFPGLNPHRVKIPEGLIETARLQQRLSVNAEPGFSRGMCGGNLVLCKMTRDRIEIKPFAARLPDEPEPYTAPAATPAVT